MAFRLLVAAIDFDNVAQALKGVERETDGKGNVEDRIRMRPAKMMGKGYQISTAKVKVFEDEENKASGNNTDH